MDFKQLGDNQKAKLNSLLKTPATPNRETQRLMSPGYQTGLTPVPSLMNQNRVSYAESETLGTNKLIKPIVNRVYQKPADSVWSRKQSRLHPTGPFSPEADSSRRGGRTVSQLQFNSDGQHYWNLNPIEMNQSPQTTHSSASYLNRRLLREGVSKYYSSQQSSNLISGLNLKTEPNFGAGKILVSKAEIPNLVNNFLIKPQTNNNYNIFNVINDRVLDPQQPEHSRSVLRKRDDRLFGSSGGEGPKGPVTLGAEGQLCRLESNVPPNSENDEEETKIEEDDITLKFKIKGNCEEKCQSCNIKCQILELANKINSTPKTCIELSFDNSLTTNLFAKIANVRKKPKLAQTGPEPLPETKQAGAKGPSDLVHNIVRNSFLRNPERSAYVEQLTKTIRTVLNKLQNNSELVYHKVNIFTLINLQVPLDNDKFHGLAGSVKLRVICMLYAKYVNRKHFSQLCSRFLTDVDFDKEALSESVLFR